MARCLSIWGFCQFDFIEIVNVRMTTSNPYTPNSIVDWLRAAAAYIHDFSGRTFVIAFGGEVVDDAQFVTLSYDINLLASLNVRLLLVHGARPQIEARLRKIKHDPVFVNGLRVTDDITMDIVREVNGALRVDIEAIFSAGLHHSYMAGSNIKITSGNFVLAKPLGVRDGIDLQHTGEVRKIDSVNISALLQSGQLVLLSPLGYSLTGEIFNLTVEDVAVSAAIALSADKLIFLMDSDGIHNAQGHLLREMSVSKAQHLLAHIRAKEKATHLSDDLQYFLPAAVRACEHGVARVHLINRHRDGALIQELFTQHGVGTMLSRDSLKSIRSATLDDVSAILQLIEPWAAKGMLVTREREQLEQLIQCFYVMEYEQNLIGCAALYPFVASKMAEFACFVIAPEFQSMGCGNQLFAFCENQARVMGFSALFCLTTRAAHWFIEHGFVEQALNVLPPERQAGYDVGRNSKVFVKTL